MFKNILVLLTLLVTAAITHEVYGQGSPNGLTANKKTDIALSESEKIERLITCLRNMQGAHFIRNGSEHSAQEAAEHLESKWKKHRSKIKTADEFIEHLATKPSSSGEPYKIRFADGKTMPTAEVLHKELELLSSGSEN